MTTMDRLDRNLRDFVKMYKWQRIDPVPWAVMNMPLAEARLGLVVHACMTQPDQPPFRAEEPEFDASIRIIDSDTDPQTLVNTYPGQGFDHAGLEADANLLVPLDRLHEMVERAEIGGVTERTVSLCGHLPHPRQLIDETAPQIARIFIEDRADVVLLVPA